MAFDFATVVATAGVSGIVQVGVWFAFQRQIQRMDTERDALKAEVTKLRDNEIVRINAALVHGEQSRGRAFDKIDSVEKNVAVHESRLYRIEIDADKFDAAVSRLGEITARQEAMTLQIANLQDRQDAMMEGRQRG